MKNKINYSLVIAVLSMIVSLYSCDNTGKKAEPTDTPTSGEVNIAIDESYSLLFDTQIYTFESLYENATVHARYLPETEALKSLMDDSVKVVVMNRALNETEKQSFKAQNIYPIETKIAEDAIAFVVSNENPDTSLLFDQIKKILNGSDSTWKQVNPNSTLGKLNIIFDNPNSANARYIAEFSKQDKLPPNAFAVKSNAEVIDYVSKNKGALGVVSVNWISDNADSTSISFLKKIKVIGISKEGDSERFYKPYQAYIKTKDYPFCRDVYMINRQTRAGLGKGFVSFVAGTKGQLIILKMGLVPAIAPVRMIEIN
jgi:phosphate transport system substrate-binding protein